jgi:hypothetical protein
MRAWENEHDSKNAHCNSHFDDRSFRSRAGPSSIKPIRSGRRFRAVTNPGLENRNEGSGIREIAESAPGKCFFANLQ